MFCSELVKNESAEQYYFELFAYLCNEFIVMVYKGIGIITYKRTKI